MSFISRTQPYRDFGLVIAFSKELRFQTRPRQHHRVEPHISEHHLLNLIQTHHVVSPIIKLRGPRALMRRHLLRLLEIPAIRQVNSDPCCPEGMTADFGPDPSFSRSPLDHPKGIVPTEGLRCEPAGFKIG